MGKTLLLQVHWPGLAGSGDETLNHVDLERKLSKCLTNYFPLSANWSYFLVFVFATMFIKLVFSISATPPVHQKWKQLLP